MGRDTLKAEALVNTWDTLMLVGVKRFWDSAGSVDMELEAARTGYPEEEGRSVFIIEAIKEDYG